MSTVICMKWGTKFGPEYVNRLHRMVTRHLSRPHRFVCFTDDGTGLAAGIDARPLPPMDLPPGKERGWRKLSTFQAPLADLEGPTLFLDLDLVILDSLDPFFEYPGEFCIIHDWLRPGRITGNSSIYRFEANAHPGVFADFMADIDAVKQKHRNEQAYLSQWMYDRGLMKYWPKEWAVSFKRHCIPPFPLNYWKAPAKPAGARVLVFHGSPTPEEAMAGRIRGALRHIKPSPWLRELWG